MNDWICGNKLNSFPKIRPTAKPDTKPIRILIHDLKGQELRELYNGFKLQGDHMVEWNGRSNMGLHVPGGVYVYTILSSEAKLSKKMIFLK